jgi:hypothetical protein
MLKHMLRVLSLVALALLCGAAKPTKSKKGKKAPAKIVAPVGPAWASQPPKFSADGQTRAFVAVGKSDDDRHPEAAEDDARQAIGGLVAKWQERTLKCANQASETQVTAQKGNSKGALLDVTLTQATSVALYKEAVVERGALGKTAVVLMRHDLESMIQGITYDTSRSENLRAAVKSCGQKAFDDLARL